MIILFYLVPCHGLPAHLFQILFPLKDKHRIVQMDTLCPICFENPVLIHTKLFRKNIRKNGANNTILFHFLNTLIHIFRYLSMFILRTKYLAKYFCWILMIGLILMYCGIASIFHFINVPFVWQEMTRNAWCKAILASVEYCGKAVLVTEPALLLWKAQSVIENSSAGKGKNQGVLQASSVGAGQWW